MQDYQREFIELAIESEVLRFGEFTLKSGRVSPYFFNAGLFNSGRRLMKLGEYYAAAINDSAVEYDTLFGPAYKGIPLVSSVAIAQAAHHGRDLPYCFNRKEAKAHGEGGSIVGAALTGRVLIIDDVITAGTAIRESMALIEQAGARAAGVVIALDRQERGQGEYSAVQEIEQTYAIPVVSIITLEDLSRYLAASQQLQGHLQAIERYRTQYGI